MQLNLVTALISILLFLIMFFGIGFVANMLLRRTWVLAFCYPLIALYFIGGFSLLVYFTDTSKAFSHLMSVKWIDVVILSAGFIGALISGYTTKALRSRGYQMF